MYREHMHKLQQQGTSVQDVDYHLTTDGLVRFRDKIYVSDNSELKKLILLEFHVKLYSCHTRYQKILTTVKKLYYWSNLKKEGAEFITRCSDFQEVKVECKNLGGFLQPILIPMWKWRSFPWISSQVCRGHLNSMILLWLWLTS